MQPLLLKFNTLVNPNEVVKQWVVYSVRDIQTAKMIFVGTSKITQLFNFADFRKLDNYNMDDSYIIMIEDIVDNIGLAERSAATIRIKNNVRIYPQLRSTPVRCVDTGETFNSLVDACQTHGLTQSHLSNHLNRKPGFKTVKGKIYEKITFDNNSHL